MPFDLPDKPTDETGIEPRGQRKSWREEACPRCKGYPGYAECTCPDIVKQKKELRRG